MTRQERLAVSVGAAWLILLAAVFVSIPRSELQTSGVQESPRRPVYPDGYRTCGMNNGSPRWDVLDGAQHGTSPSATISGQPADYAEHEIIELESYLIYGDKKLDDSSEYAPYHGFADSIAALNPETRILTHFNIGDQFKFEQTRAAQEDGALAYTGAKWLASIPSYMMETDASDSISLYTDSWECDHLTHPALRSSWVNFVLAFKAASTNGTALNVWPMAMDGLGYGGLATGYRASCGAQPASNGRPLWVGVNYCANVTGMLDLDGDGTAFELDANYYSTGVSEVVSYTAALIATYDTLRSVLPGPLMALNITTPESLSRFDGVVIEHFPNLAGYGTEALYYKNAVDPDYPTSLPNILAGCRTDRGGPYVILSCQMGRFSAAAPQLYASDIVAMMFDGVYTQWTNFNTSAAITNEGYGQLSGPVFNTRHAAEGLGPVCFGSQFTALGTGGYWFDDSPDSLGMRLDNIGYALGPAVYTYYGGEILQIDRHFSNGVVRLRFVRETPWYDVFDNLVVVGEDTVRRRGNYLRTVTAAGVSVTSGHLYTGGTSYSVTHSLWNVSGTLKYALRRQSDSVIVGESGWSTLGVSYPGPLNGTGAEVGLDYELVYWLDCTPDIDGYTEEWKDTGVVWTQPAKFSELDTDFVPSG